MLKIVGGALFNNGRLLIVRRVPTRTVWPDLWEIPGGRVEPSDKNYAVALRREFLEETGLEIRVLREYCKINYDYEGSAATEHDYLVTSDRYSVRLDPNEHTSYAWIYRPEIGHFEMSPEMVFSVNKAFDAIG